MKPNSASQIRIQLRNLKVVPCTGQTTLCFTATILFDGIPIAKARNFGHGDTILQLLKNTSEHFAEAESFARSLSPSAIEHPFPHGQRDIPTAVTLEYLVNHLAAKIHTDRVLRAAFRRDITSKVLFLEGSKASGCCTCEA